MKNKIELRKFKMSDAEIMVKLLTKNVIKTLGIGLKSNPPKITKKFEQDWIKKEISNYILKEPKTLSFAIILNDKLIGIVNSGITDYENDATEIGFWIGEKYWGKGIMTNALKLFIKELNKKHRLKRIVARVVISNSASCKILKKCGFKLEGTQRKIIKGKNKYHDLYVYSKIQ